MNAHHKLGVLVYRLRVVRELCPVRRPDLFQFRTGLRQHIRHAEITPDLDELAARNDRLTILCKDRQDETRRRRTVAEDHRTLRRTTRPPHPPSKAPTARDTPPPRSC